MPNLTLNDKTFWEISKFEIENGLNPYEITPKLSPIWICDLPYLERTQNEKQTIVNVTGYALRTINEVHYLNQGIELLVSGTLQGESYLWIFTRCFINRDNNESDAFDMESKFITKNTAFNKYTPVIIIIKEEKLNQCNIEIGTFYELLDYPNPCYKTFFKRQLIDYSSKETKVKLIETDKCSFNITILDLGNELVCMKVNLNKSGRCNEINANFFIPCNKRAKIMIAGNGQGVELNKLFLTTKEKNGMKHEIYFSTNQQSCSCCSIF